ncbi:MAG: Cell division protein FtsK [Candidatus Ozemobacter sibiricus]|jgi:hypothetical protein|uniref:Cell division protein FtsK n=1 Tax=Candidatus Ozemobacter sibiricus TaxID=2268124 RepID=A0A367ZL12_9BACT|nr:MAG: Cell division protein FtsK [Candidatus Ozemobacter sibiricus]
MKTKRILMAEPVARPRKSSRPKRPAAAHPPPMPFLVSQRQRSEAIGLVLVGFSAFSLTLLHYLSNSRVSGLVNLLTVYFGLGMYIVPILIGIMGIQRFMDRPFKNLGLRLMGMAGSLIFGLGLLGLEGGKIGLYTAEFFASRFGTVPTHILFVFLCAACLIFALDILYKDVLLILLAATELSARLGVFLWEAGLAGLALGITACKRTFRAGALIVARLSALARAHQLQLEARSGASLLPEPDDPTAAQDDLRAAEQAHRIGQETLALAGAAGGHLPATATIPLEASPESPALASACEYSLAIQTVAIAATTPTLTVCPPPVRSEPPVQPPPAPPSPVPANPAPSERITASNAGPTPAPTATAAASPIPASVETSAESSQDTPPQDLTDSPVSLDDHPIDEQIKAQEELPYPDRDHSKPDYTRSSLPPLDLLRVPPPKEENPENDLSARSELLLKTLEEFGLRATITDIVEGPAVSRFEIRPAPGIKVARITSLINEIAMNLSAQSIRIEAPIPGKSAMGIEIPNPKPTPVYFYDLVKNENFRTNKTLLNLALGMNISKRPVYADLAEMPHLLIAGSTGSGKSVCINTIIASILFQARADQVKMVMIDPKMVELSGYNGIPHLISPVVTDPKKAADALQWAVEEMVRRYEFLSGVKARNISDYNRELPRLQRELDEGLEPMPLIVIIIDELADLMMTSSAQVEGAICRLSQMSRAVGIHLVIATQRPSVDVLTGLIKANLPSRIAFFVSSQIDSRTIIDEKGAEKLLGKGDMLFKFKGRPMPLRVQGAYISDQELTAITEFVKSQGKPEYIDIEPIGGSDDQSGESPDENGDAGGDEDSQLLAAIADYLSTQEKTSTSMLQRKFKIGYNRAARIMDLLEEKGMVSPLDGSNKRRVLTRRSTPLS